MNDRAYTRGKYQTHFVNEKKKRETITVTVDSIIISKSSAFSVHILPPFLTSIVSVHNSVGKVIMQREREKNDTNKV